MSSAIERINALEGAVLGGSIELSKKGMAMVQLEDELLALWEAVNSTQDGIVCTCGEILQALNALNARAEEVLR